ncbi:hypothetical protein [Actinophytocola sp.]|uniref:hypothetical protein n=1 Tax=Actinophytocola sp. TaxID=1872138 RepID=UPI002E188D25
MIFEQVCVKFESSVPTRGDTWIFAEHDTRRVAVFAAMQHSYRLMIRGPVRLIHSRTLLNTAVEWLRQHDYGVVTVDASWLITSRMFGDVGSALRPYVARGGGRAGMAGSLARQAPDLPRAVRQSLPEPATDRMWTLPWFDQEQVWILSSRGTWAGSIRSSGHLRFRARKWFRGRGRNGESEETRSSHFNI